MGSWYNSPSSLWYICIQCSWKQILTLRWGIYENKGKPGEEKCPDGTCVGANMSLFFFILQRKWNPHLKNALLLESLGKFMQFFLINMFLQRHIKKNVRIISAERVLKYPFLYFFISQQAFYNVKSCFFLHCSAERVVQLISVNLEDLALINAWMGNYMWSIK